MTDIPSMLKEAIERKQHALQRHSMALGVMAVLENKPFKEMSKRIATYITEETDYYTYWQKNDFGGLGISFNLTITSKEADRQQIYVSYAKDYESLKEQIKRVIHTPEDFASYDNKIALLKDTKKHEQLALLAKQMKELSLDDSNLIKAIFSDINVYI